MKRFAVIATYLTAALLAQAHALQTGGNASIAYKTGLIEGSVIDAQNNHLPDVPVMASGSKEHFTVTTDSNGEYVFRDLPAGLYRIFPMKAEFGKSAFEAMRTVTVADGTASKGVNLTIPAPSTLTGRVFDEADKPVSNATVLAYVKFSQNGKTKLRYRGQSNTDEAGAYRIWGLAKGTYYIYVSAGRLFPRIVTSNALVKVTKTISKNVNTFYPSGLSLQDATAILLAAGQTLESLDVRLRRVTPICVRAAIVADPAGPTYETSVTLLDGQISEQQLGWGKIPAGARFEFCGLGPGSYSFDVQRLTSDSTSAFGQESFSLEKRDLDLGQISLFRGQTVAGQVEYAADGEKTHADKQLLVSLQPLNHLPVQGESVMSKVDKNTGSFSLLNVPIDRYEARFSGTPRGSYLKAAWAGNRNLLQEPFVPGMGDLRIVLGIDGAAVTCLTIDKEGRPVTDATVLVIANDRSMLAASGGIRLMRTDQNGEARSEADLPPGDYKVLALTGMGIDPLLDDEALAGLMSSAIDLTLNPSASKAITVKPVAANP